MKYLSIIVMGFFITTFAHAKLPEAKSGLPFKVETNTPNGLNEGEIGNNADSNILHNNAYTCWARTDCWNGQSISCQATGDKGCRWELSPNRYVHCEAYDWNGSTSQVTYYCP
ncbi:MAG: hypothetical protein KA116_06770 [Proteobacteria bacterium]|nr:hypothetical protein [Pseudomonadota bacterium]